MCDDLPNLIDFLLISYGCLPQFFVNTALSISIRDPYSDEIDKAGGGEGAPTWHQAYRLLDRLRNLHSIRNVYIKGPISVLQQAVLKKDLGRSQRSLQELFNNVFSIKLDAKATVEASDFGLAIEKLIGTLDAWYSVVSQVPDAESKTEILIGEVGGYTLRQAKKSLEFTLGSDLTEDHIEL